MPYPKDQDTFWQLVKLGEEIRKIHLLESPVVGQPITQYPVVMPHLNQYSGLKRTDQSGCKQIQ